MLESLIRRGPNGAENGEKVGLGSIRRPIIGLALGGGAARGFAHIGVIRTLLNQGIVPDIVVGTSIGAVVGGGSASDAEVSMTAIASPATRVRPMRAGRVMASLLSWTLLGGSESREVSPRS